MDKPRIFLGSSTAQIPLVEALTVGLADVADVEPWMSVFNPGTTTIERLLELTHQVDFAAFVFAQDDWTSDTPAATAAPIASPRDNVVFEAGLFGGVLGMRRTFILHAKGAKLPTDLLGLTSIRYADAEVDAADLLEKLRSAILARTAERPATIDGAWWQFSLTARTPGEPSALSLLHVTREPSGALAIAGRSWGEDGSLTARYWSEASRERTAPSGIFYYFNGERPRDPNAPHIDGTGEILLESADRATGYWITSTSADAAINARTSGVYLRADPADAAVLDGDGIEGRAALIATQLKRWQALANS
jgi:hypothetical protein